MTPRRFVGHSGTLLLSLAFCTAAPAETVGTAFTYQGRLSEAGAPYDAAAAMTFTLWDAAMAGNQVGPTLTFDGQGANDPPVEVSDGVFTVHLDFGDSPFDGDALWLEITVNGTTLSPRQELTAAPYATYAAASPGSRFWRDATTPNDIAYGQTGKVGIGTTDPAETLHVRGTARIDGVEGDFSTRLHLLGGGDVEPESGGFLVMGDVAATNVAIDSNEIMARSNGAASTLFLNADGGSVGIGGGTPAATLHVRKTDPATDTPGVDDYDFVAMFEHTGDGEADGIAIRIDDSHTSRTNNYVTFFDGVDNVVGRIEGFDKESGDWQPPPVLNDLDVEFDLDFENGTSPSLSISWSNFSHDWNNGSLPSFGNPPISFDGLPSSNEWETLLAWGMSYNLQSFMTTDPAALASAALKSAAIQEVMDEGVVYGSRGADYAEWLPKLNPTDRFQMGQIVGVHAGSVSLKTDGADHIMATSYAPVVLGNQPPEGEADAYAKVAFMGQVKVVVRGPVTAGDYIIASGRNDGTGVAIQLGDLKLEQVNRILGRAWSDSTNERISLINVSIGLTTREWAGLMAQQQQEIQQSVVVQDEIRNSMMEMQAAIAAQSATLAQNRAEIAGLLKRIETIESNPAATRPR